MVKSGESNFCSYRVVIGAETIGDNSRIAYLKRARNEYVVKLGTRERMSDVSGKGIVKIMLDETLLYMRAFPCVQRSVTEASAKDPVERRDMRLLKNIEVAADD